MPIRTGAEYINSLRGRNLKVYLFVSLSKDPVEHPIIRPSINAVAETYDLAVREEELATAKSSLTGQKLIDFCILCKAPKISSTKINAKKAGTKHWYMLPEMCWHGCIKLTLFCNL